MLIKKTIRQLFLLMICSVLLAVSAAAQSGLEKWKNFDFSKSKLKRADIAKLDQDNLAFLRGIVFGKRGRIFVEKDIQNLLAKQSWYKPNPKFSNSILTANERANLDLIRGLEAEAHYAVRPGDLRYWTTKVIPEEKISTESAAEWAVLIAEFEAIHGKTFEDEWLQKYFDERYWYKRNPNYSSTVLSSVERQNLENFIKSRDKDRKVAVSLGDMDKFQNALLTEQILEGLNFNELRLIRNEFWARRGKKFVTPGFLQYFEWRDWYKPLKDQTKVKLNPIEEQNVKLIENVEAKKREELSTKLLNEDELQDLFAEDLRIMRNEIYARRGKIYKTKDLNEYFSSQSWYKPDPNFSDAMFTDIEHKNLNLIKEVEKYASSKFSVVEG